MDFKHVLTSIAAIGVLLTTQSDIATSEPRITYRVIPGFDVRDTPSEFDRVAADHVIFWGMNLGWAGFALVELFGALGFVRIFTPIMGISLLIGVATYWLRLGRPAERPAARQRVMDAAGS